MKTYQVDKKRFLRKLRRSIRREISIGMYHTDQYMAPSGEYSTVTAKDGTTWYKQYATDTVQRTPYKAPDNTIAYKESIVKKLPDPPRRKDRV